MLVEQKTVSFMIIEKNTIPFKKINDGVRQKCQKMTYIKECKFF